jgi:exosortase/archaeosortase family protein
VPTATAGYRHRPAFEFALRGIAWSIALFGALRLAWFETHAVLPLTHLQGRIAERSFGAPSLPLELTLACSGADALALCAGAILAYPAPWRSRAGGAAGGVGLILVLNTIRIGTLGRVAASPTWFTALHVYVWPGLLMLTIAGYVFGWMRFVDDPRAHRPGPLGPAVAGQSGPPRRFVLLTAVLVVLFTAGSSIYLESALVLAVAAFVTRAASSTLAVLGIASIAVGNVLSTDRGAFLVTQECISTPLIPVYLAAACTFPRTWSGRALAAAAAVPLFVALGIARLLVVALPATLVASPMFLIHAFYQLLLAAVVVVGAACWRHGLSAAALCRGGFGLLLGWGIAAVLGGAYDRAVLSGFADASTWADPQGATIFLPAFQVGLYAALCVAVFARRDWRMIAIGLALVGLSQGAGFAILQFVLRHTTLVPHVRDVRAWAVAAPVLVVAALVGYDRSGR